LLYIIKLVIYLVDKVIGILGGMGPEATADLFIRIIRATPAKKDQDHIRVIIDSNPKIPDRTAAILGRGADSLPEMVETARNLERAGADFIVMPCNTAHYYYEELKKSVGIPVLNMIELTTHEIKKRFPNVRKVGLIATTGTVKTKIYDQMLKRIGVKVIYPTTDLQDSVMKAIYNYIKAGHIMKGREIIVNAANHLAEKGSELIICGCTEVSLVLKSGDLSIPIIDPLQILAEAAVAKALDLKDRRQGNKSNNEVVK
jgi:aspartate racemase